MIRSYSRVPRFDDGLNSYYQPNTNTYLAGLEAAGYIPASSTPMDGEYNPYLDPANYDTYTPEEAAAIAKADKEYLNSKEPAVTPTQIRANTRSASAPIRKPTTTAVLDHKAATLQYRKAISAAKKKAALENASAKKAIANANATLKRNGLKTYSLGNITSTMQQLPEITITGSKSSKSKNLVTQSAAEKYFRNLAAYRNNGKVAAYLDAAANVGKKITAQRDKLLKQELDIRKNPSKYKSNGTTPKRRYNSKLAPGGMWNILNWFK